MIEKREGLLALVLKALSIEGNLSQLPSQTQATYRKAVEESLLEVGVPRHVIFRCDVTPQQLTNSVSREEVKTFVSSGAAQGDKWHTFLGAIHDRDEIRGYSMDVGRSTVTGWAVVREGVPIAAVEKGGLRFQLA